MNTFINIDSIVTQITFQHNKPTRPRHEIQAHARNLEASSLVTFLYVQEERQKIHLCRPSYPHQTCDKLYCPMQLITTD
jgi:hypothetical protein